MFPVPSVVGVIKQHPNFTVNLAWLNIIIFSKFFTWILLSSFQMVQHQRPCFGTLIISHNEDDIEVGHTVWLVN